MDPETPYSSIYACRLPGAAEFEIFKGIAEPGLKPGFVIAPFQNPAEGIMTIIPAERGEFRDFAPLSLSAPLSETPSTSRAEHRAEVEGIIAELQGDSHRKTIACRIISGEGALDVEASLRSLAENLPNSFVFAFHTPDSGSWIGASPELLLSGKGDTWKTFALAGTRPAGTSAKWDSKNILEHRIVVDYIADRFREHGMEPQIPDSETRQAGEVEHLLNQISARATSETASLLDFLADFSPTPALCGMPKEESLERIARFEKFPRRYYGGFCGLFSSPSDFSFFVILRSLEFDATRFRFYAGGGITSQSDPDEEWLETERKANSIIRYLKLD